MVKTASLFSQLLQHFLRTEFTALVKKHGAERGAIAAKFNPLSRCPSGSPDQP